MNNVELEYIVERYVDSIKCPCCKGIAVECDSTEEEEIKRKILFYCEIY